MKREQRRSLEKKLEQEIVEAGRLLIAQEEGESETIDSRLKRIEHYSKLLGARKKSSKLWAIGVALVCIILVAVLLFVKKADNKVLLVIQSSALRINLAEPWTNEQPFDGSKSVLNNEVRIENSSNVEAPPIPRGTDTSISSLNIKSNNAQITKLKIDQGAEIELLLENSVLTFSANQSRIESILEFKGNASLNLGDERTYNIASPRVPETILFASKEDTAVPLVISIAREMFLPMRDLKLGALQFSRMEAIGPGSDSFQSAIKKGSITLYGAGRDEQVHEGDRLVLKGIKAKRTSISFLDQIELKFEGSIDEVLVGPEGSEKNLAPSLLEYFYHNKPLALFWSSVVFLASLAWSVKKTLFE